MRSIRLLIAGKVKRGAEDYWRRVDTTIEQLHLSLHVRRDIRFIPDDEVEVYFKAADAVVLPYVDIYQSGVLFLALSFGTPVIGTDVRIVNPDLLLLDLQMPRMTGLEALCDLAARHATPPTILLAGAIERPHLLNAVRLGVRGFVLKEFTAELLFEAIMCVLAGQYWLGSTLVTDFMESVRPLIQPAPVAVPGGAALTRREREVIARVVSGCANKEIALEFSVSEETVKHHLTRIFAKVGAANRVELAMLARTYGLVDAADPLA